MLVLLIDIDHHIGPLLFLQEIILIFGGKDRGFILQIDLGISMFAVYVSTNRWLFDYFPKSKKKYDF